MSSVFRSTKPADRVLLEDGSVLQPVASFTAPKGCRAHIVLDEECYVLYIENMAGISTKSMWIFPEAHRVLRGMPAPSKTKNKETELSIVLRALTASEVGTEQFDQAAAEVYRLLPSAAKEALNQIVESGPVYDGDAHAPSKQPRDLLTSMGLICRVVMNGTDGWNAANYLGFKVYNSRPTLS